MGLCEEDKIDGMLWCLLRKIPSIRFWKRPADEVQDLYARYPDGVERGCVVYVIGENWLYTWDIELKRWKPLGREDIRVSGVSLNKTAMSLRPGEEEMLTATVTPENASNKGVLWLSSNPVIASVDQSGKVKANTVGEAVISAVAIDGGYVASCGVVVEAGVIAVTGVSLNKSTLSLYENGVEQLTATISPSNATNKAVTWGSSNEAVATVDQSGSIKAIAPGGATITVTTADGGKTASCVVTVNSSLVGYWGYNSVQGKIPESESDILGLQNEVGALYKGKTFVMDIAEGSFVVCLAYPAELGDLGSFKYEQLGNVEYKNYLTKTTIAVGGKLYNVYYYSAIRANSAMTFNVTI